jgi:hypothetical protein
MSLGVLDDGSSHSTDPEDDDGGDDHQQRRALTSCFAAGHLGSSLFFEYARHRRGVERALPPPGTGAVGDRGRLVAPHSATQLHKDGGADYRLQFLGE